MFKHTRMYYNGTGSMRLAGLGKSHGEDGSMLEVNTMTQADIKEG